MKANYAAWSIDASAFSEKLSPTEKLKFFARYAVLAPSGHNTQPWRFSIDKEQLLLYADKTRVLPYSGVEANEPYVSLGACLQTLLLAARGFGYELLIEYTLKNELVARVSLGKQTAADSSLLESITNRASNRFRYEEAPLPEGLLAKLIATVPAGASATVVDQADDKSFIGKQTEQATYRVFKDSGFRNELSKWVRNNLTKQFDGMPGFVQGIPTPPSLLAKYIISHVDISKDQVKKDVGRVLNSSALILVTTQDNSPASLLDGGRLYAQICVLAQQAGLATAGVGTAVIDPLAREEIVKHFALQGLPIAIIRIGKAVKPALHAPRWPLETVFD